VLTLEVRQVVGRDAGRGDGLVDRMPAPQIDELDHRVPPFARPARLTTIIVVERMLAKWGIAGEYDDFAKAPSVAWRSSAYRLPPRSRRSLAQCSSRFLISASKPRPGGS